MIFDIYYQDNGENSAQPYTYPWTPKKADLPSRSEFFINLNKE